MIEKVDKRLEYSNEHFKKSFPQEPEKLPTKRLISVLHKARAHRSSIANYHGPRCCEFCHEYIGDDWENDVGKFLVIYDSYIEKLKTILATRPHIERENKYGIQT